MDSINSEYVFNNRNLKDLSPIKAGRVACSSPPLPPDPRIRDYATLYFMTSGFGTLRKGNVEHSVHAGQCFMLLPGEFNTLRAEQRGPWEYVWVSFSGSFQSEFAELFKASPIASAPEELFREIIQTFETSTNVDNLAYFLAGKLFQLYFLLSKEKDVSYSAFVRRAKNYIDTMYMHDISVQDISDMLNMDRHYLSRVFKKQVGQTMQAYLLQVRLSKAALLIKDNCTVSQAAQMVGYSDISNFSRKFKEVFGVTPKDYGRKTPQKPKPQPSAPTIPDIRGGNWSPKQWGR